MKYLLIFLFFIILACSNNPKQNEPLKKNQNATHSKILSSDTDKKQTHNNELSKYSYIKFEFEKELQKVQIVSYTHPRGQHTQVNSVPQKKYDIKIKENGKLGFKEFQEIIVLDSVNIKMLRGILAQNWSDTSTVSECYIPRNAIHFIGEKDLLLGYIEICAECNQTKSSSNELAIKSKQQLYALTSFMRRAGIKHGF